MDVYWSLSYWFFQPQFWLIVGILLVIIDIFLLGSSFLLPIGISALILSVLVYFDSSNVWEFQLFDTWRKILLYFGIFSVASIFIIKIFIKVRGDKGKDINQYQDAGFGCKRVEQNSNDTPHLLILYRQQPSRFCLQLCLSPSFEPHASTYRCVGW